VSDRDRYNEEILFPLAEEFFEARIVGDIDRIRSLQRPVIFVGNHSGGSLSWDNIIFQALLDRLDQGVVDNKISLVRVVHSRLYDDVISPFCIQGWWRSMGCEPVSLEAIVGLLEEGRNVFMSPEGAAGLSKPGWRPEQLLRFSSSFVYAAKRADAVVVPVAIHGSSYLNPFSIGFTWADKLADRVLKWPLFPFSPLLPLVSLPRNFIYPWPARMVYELLDPVELAGPNEVETNRSQAESIRNGIVARLSSNKRGIVKSTNWRALLRDDYGLGMYRQFWATHLRRPLRRSERLLFNLPFVGYHFVKRFARRAGEAQVICEVNASITQDPGHSHSADRTA